MWGHRGEMAFDLFELKTPPKRGVGGIEHREIDHGAHAPATIT